MILAARMILATPIIVGGTAFQVSSVASCLTVLRLSHCFQYVVPVTVGSSMYRLKLGLLLAS